MYCFIGIEDLVANALIEIVEKTSNRTVSFSQLNKYGEAIIAKLKTEKVDATLIFNRNTTDQFFHDCSNIFSITETENDILITLNDNVSTTYLRKRFRVNLALHMLSAFVSEDVIKEIISI